MSQNTRILRRFEYHLDDTECRYCKHYKGKKHDCHFQTCCCDDIRKDAIKHSRIKRKRGYFTYRE